MELDKKIGNLDLSMKLENGKVVLGMNYEHGGISAMSAVGVSPRVFLDQLKNLIPGDVDNKVIDMLEAAFGL